MKWPSIILAFLLTIFVRIVVTKEQTVLMAVSTGQYRKAWLGFKAMFFSSFSIVKVPAKDLRECAKDCYVDTPLYHTGSWLMRWLQWGKLRALWRLREGNGHNILDFGCGNGVMLPTFAEHFKQVIGYDIEVDAARNLKLKYDLTYVDIRRGHKPSYLPFWDKHFDVIWASSVLEHIKDLDMAIYQLYRVLKPGGQLLFLSPNENWIYRLGRKLCGLKKPADHYHTGEEIEEALEKYFTCEVKKRWPPIINLYVLGRYRRTER